MSAKSLKISRLVERCQQGDHPAYYLAYFECFNSKLFYDAHDVLEALWLAERRAPNGDFYKGLIQFAGAFVHLQKDRLRPAAALLKLARANLQKYPANHLDLNVTGLLRSLDGWLARLEAANFSVNPLATEAAPQLFLEKIAADPAP